MVTRHLTDALDTVLDRSVVLGYTRIGPALRRRWWPPDPAPGSMTGRTVLVTGATSGIGRTTAAGLARLGATVHVLGRDPEHLDAALSQIRAEVPGGRFHGELCNLGDLAAVRAFGQDFARRVPQLRGLAHNAGTIAPERRETADGHELTLATMLLGPHLLTDLLRDSLAAADASIVVFMSSGGMYAARLHAEDPEFTSGDYSGTKAYARVKRMQVVLAQMWAEELRTQGIEVASMHPGWVDTAGLRTHLPRFRALTLPLMRSDAEGADTMVWLLATRPTADGARRFWHDRRLRPTSFGRESDQDPDERQRLWDYVAVATGTAPDDRA